MASGEDGATPGPASAMSVEEAWSLVQAEDDNPESWGQKRDAILADIKAKLENSSPLQYLEKTYPSVQDKEQYAPALWQEFPPMDSNPPLLAGHLPGKPMGSLTAQDVCVVHLAGISFLRKNMVCEPTLHKIFKLADSILTDGFVTETEPLLLDVSPTHLEEATVHTYDNIPPWG